MKTTVSRNRQQPVPFFQIKQIAMQKSCSLVSAQNQSEESLLSADTPNRKERLMNPPHISYVSLAHKNRANSTRTCPESN